MNVIKKFLSIGLVIIVYMYLFIGCGQKTNISEKDTKKIKIGVCFSGLGGYGSYMLSEMKNYSKSLNDVEVLFVDAKHDSNTQLAQVEDFISQRVDVIVVNPVYTDATKAITDKAKVARIPIISFMLPFENQNDAASFIRPDSKQSGTLQMEYLAKKMNFKGNVAVIMGPIEDMAQRLRTEAYREVVAKYPEMKIVAEQTADWDRARGKALMESWFQAGKEIDGVACNNDEMAIGALLAVESAGKLDKIMVSGIDGTPEALNYLKSGKLTFTLFQDASKIGKSTLETAVKAARGDKVEEKINIQNELVTPENVDVYIAKWKE